MPEGARILTVFVPGKVRRQDNGSQGSWRKRAGYRKAWRQRVEAFVLSSGYRYNKIDPITPKTIRMIANTFNLFDEDGLGAALKPHVDALVSSGIIHSDKPFSHSGHLILKGQQIDRQNEGVRILVNVGTDLSTTPDSSPGLAGTGEANTEPARATG